MVDKVTTTATQTMPTRKPIIWGNWKIDVDNNAVASARVVFKLYFYKL